MDALFYVSTWVLLVLAALHWSGSVAIRAFEIPVGLILAVTGGIGLILRKK